MDNQLSPAPEQPAPSPSTRRERVGWYFYDWANSAFPTTVLTVFLGPYLTSITRAAADAGGYVYPLGIQVNAGSFFPFLLSLAGLSQVVVLPILGAVADYSHRKKQMLAIAAYLGAAATLAMFFLQGTNYLLGGALFLLANLAFGASVVFYNAFLPELSGPDERDSLSSKGWALGYLGGGLLLALNVALFSRAGALGLTSGDAARICLASAGAWWAVFTLVPLFGLRNRQPVRRLPPGGHYLTVGFRQLAHTIGQARRYPQTLLFLAAYLLYNDGIQTVIGLSTQFGQEELGLPLSTLTTVILMVQFVGFFGAILFGRLARILGTRRAIILSLLGWTAALVYAYGFLHTAVGFYVLGAVIAVVLGGSQALSRSFYSLMIPRGQEAEYYSLYEVSEKGTSSLGPFLVGVTLQMTGSFRLGILSLAIFFVVGLVLLSRVNARQAALAAGNKAPLRA